MALKFMIHHIEHVNEYEKADPRESLNMDDKVVKLMQKGKASERNGHLSYTDLRKFVSANPKLIQALLKHQRELHAHLQKYYPNLIKDNRIALTRGLSTEKPTKDHPLASYADKPDTGFGSHMHHRRVPLNNIWYTYMLGPKEATSENYGNENEWLVSPHKIVKADREDVKAALPRENWHNLKEPYPGHIVYMDPNKMTEEYINNVVESDPYNAISLLKNNPMISKKHIDKMVEGDPSFAAEELQNHPLFDKKNIDTVINDDPAQAAKYLSTHPLFDRSHIDKIIEKAPGSARTYLKDHPLLKKGTLKKSIDAPSQTVSTKRTPSGMFFHTFQDGDNYTHILSHSADPYSEDDAVAASQVTKNGSDNNLKWTITDRKHQGKGLATQLYIEMMSHHKALHREHGPEDLDKSTDKSHKVAILSD